MASIEIHAFQTISGNQAHARRIIEEAAQTFLPGTPVQISATDGGLKAWDGVTVTDAIAGFSLEAANNLAALGVLPTAAVTPAQAFVFPPGNPASVPNQPAARNIGRPWFNDGRVGFEIAHPDTIFRAQVGPAQTALNTDVGQEYGMTKDSDGHWYIDKNKTGASAVVSVVKLDPLDQSATPRGVYFTIIPSASQLVV